MEIGTLIAGRYRVEAFLTRGNATELWQARDLILRRAIAVRIVRTQLLDNEHYIGRFAQEAQILAALEHPHIMPIYDYGIHAERPYQIQRLIGTQTLENYTEADHKLPTLDVVRLVQRIGNALDYIHAQGIVHRDVAPHNIILDAQGLPYLVNFSLAHLTDGSGINWGDAPERASQSADPSTDIYAFGLLLYQLLSGKRPRFRHNNLATPVREHRPDLPIGVDLVIHRLTRYHREERYETAAAAIDELYRAFYGGQDAVEGRIFVSYARKDSDYVYTLAQELRRIGLNIWIDQDIEPGSNWDNSIEAALNSCDALLLIASEASMRSSNVQDEWSYFLEQGKSVFPFIYQPCELSFRLRRRQYIESTGDLLTDVARVVDVLAGGNPTQFNALANE